MYFEKDRFQYLSILFIFFVLGLCNGTLFTKVFEIFDRIQKNYHFWPDKIIILLIII